MIKRAESRVIRQKINTKREKFFLSHSKYRRGLPYTEQLIATEFDCGVLLLLHICGNRFSNQNLSSLSIPWSSYNLSSPHSHSVSGNQYYECYFPFFYFSFRSVIFKVKHCEAIWIRLGCNCLVFQIACILAHKLSCNYDLRSCLSSFFARLDIKECFQLLFPHPYSGRVFLIAL